MDTDRRLLLTSAGLGLGVFATATAASGTSTASAPGQRAPAGLTPDTGRDQTAQLQRAIDEAAAACRPLLLPPGRFLIATLKLRSGTRIQGSGPATHLQHLGGGPAILVDGAEDVAVSDLTIAGGRPLTTGRALIEAIAVERLQIASLHVTGAPASGIMLERCSGRVTSCTVDKIAKAAIFCLDATGIEISHNHIADCANNGILVWRSAQGEDGTLVASNRIERIAAADGGSGQNGNGINIFRAGGVIVSGNRVSRCAFSAVRANSASNVQITSNSVSRVGEVALYAEFAFEGAVIASNVVDGAATGISVTNFNEGGRLAVVQGNLVRNLVLRPGPDVCGDGIAVEADASVTGNVIEGAPSTGIVIGFGAYGRDVVATGNIVRRCGIGIGITAATGTGPVLVAQNLISGALNGAIRMLDHGRPVGADLTRTPSAGRIVTSANVVS